MSAAQILILIALVVFGGLFALFAIARRAYLAEYRKAFPGPVIPKEKPLGDRLEGLHVAYDPRDYKPLHERRRDWAVRMEIDELCAQVEEGI